MKDTHTVFPYGIDSRVYAQDITLNDLETFSKYQTLLAQGKYTEASVLLNNSDAYFYGAWMLNLLEKRLNAIGDYLINLEEDVLTYYSETEPEVIEYGTHWISDELRESEPEIPEEPEVPEIPEEPGEGGTDEPIVPGEGEDQGGSEVEPNEPENPDNSEESGELENPEGSEGDGEIGESEESV